MPNPFLRIWGQVVMVLYIVLVSVLIMSLVVAVITHAYNPHSVQTHAIVMQAESTFHYDFHGEDGGRGRWGGVCEVAGVRYLTPAVRWQGVDADLMQHSDHKLPQPQVLRQPAKCNAHRLLPCRVAFRPSQCGTPCPVRQ